MTQLTWQNILHYAANGNPEPPRRIVKTDAQWQAILSSKQYYITRQAGTERPFSSDVCQQFDPGVFHCVCCDSLLFNTEDKFDSGTGWPSFSQPADIRLIAYVADHSHGMTRIEARCNVCDAHLGHVFADGPAPGGLRYCINAVALRKATV